MYFRQRDCLHLLITTLCDRGETTELVGFEYGPLENEVSFLLPCLHFFLFKCTLWACSILPTLLRMYFPNQPRACLLKRKIYSKFDIVQPLSNDLKIC